MKCYDKTNIIYLSVLLRIHDCQYILYEKNVRAHFDNINVKLLQHTPLHLAGQQYHPSSEYFLLNFKFYQFLFLFDLDIFTIVFCKFSRIHLFCNFF